MAENDRWTFDRAATASRPVSDEPFDAWPSPETRAESKLLKRMIIQEHDEYQPGDLSDEEEEEEEDLSSSEYSGEDDANDVAAIGT